MFGRAFALFRANPAIAAPGLAIALLLAPARFALAPADPLDDDLARRLARSIALLFATIVSIAYTSGLADAAWKSGRATISDGARALRRDGARILGAMGSLFAIGAVAALLAPFTFGLSFLTYAFFCIYAPASAVSGDRPGLRAIAESVDLAFRRPLPTLGAVVSIAIVALAVGPLAEAIPGTPFYGAFVADVVVQLVVAYATLVIAGEYRISRETGASA